MQTAATTRQPRKKAVTQPAKKSTGHGQPPAKKAIKSPAKKPMTKASKKTAGPVKSSGKPVRHGPAAKRTPAARKSGSSTRPAKPASKPASKPVVKRAVKRPARPATRPTVEASTPLAASAETSPVLREAIGLYHAERTVNLPPDQTYSTAEAAEVLGLSVQGMKYHLYQARDLVPDRQIGRTLLFYGRSLNAFWNHVRHGPGAPVKSGNIGTGELAPA